MANDLIKRLRYFTGQFLEEDDFRAEQMYHIGHRRRANQTLWLTAGILDNGFEVRKIDGKPTFILITKGVGVDQDGRELVRLKDWEVSLPQTEGLKVVSLSYDEAETYQQLEDRDVSDNTRWQEVPRVSFADDLRAIDTNQQIVLALVEINAAGELDADPDLSVRQIAAARLPGNLTIGQGGNGCLQTRHIDGKDFSSDAQDHLFLNYATNKDVYLGFGNGSRSSLYVSGKIGVGTQSPNARLEIDMQTTNEVALRLISSGPGWGSGIQFKNTAAGSGRTFGIYSNPQGELHITDEDTRESRLVIDSRGNMGIGTSSPNAGKLQFANELGNKIVAWDGGMTDRYGFGVNGFNLNAFFPAGGRFSLRLNGFDGPEKLLVDGEGRIGTNGKQPHAGPDFPWWNTWGGGIHTFDLIADGSLWVGDRAYCKGVAVRGSTGKLEFVDGVLGDKIVIYDAGPSDRYGLGLNGGNLNAFVPVLGSFSLRQNGASGDEVFSVRGNGSSLDLTHASPEGPRLYLRNPGKGGVGSEWAIHNMTGAYGNSLQFWNYDNAGGQPSQRLIISDDGNLGIGALPNVGRIQFDNNLGNKVVVWDGGPADRYGFGLDGGNLNAFIPEGRSFSIRQNGYNGTEVFSIRGDTIDCGTFARIRCHDFCIGHPTRRGEPGRALVDSSPTLFINFGRDWQKVRIEGVVETPSSKYIKDTLGALTSELASDIVSMLEPIRFTYLSDPSKNENLGFIAEDSPREVTSPSQDAIIINHIIAALTRVVKDQAQAINDLRSRIDPLVGPSQPSA